MKTILLVVSFICLLPLSAFAVSSEQDKAYVLIHGPKIIPYSTLCISNKKDNNAILTIFAKWLNANYGQAKDVGKIFLDTLNENADELIFLIQEEISDNRAFSQNIKKQCPEIIARRDKIIKILQQE